MPLLAGWLLSIFTTMAGWFGAYLTKKAAFGAASVAVFATLTGALYVALSLLFSGIAAVMPNWPGISTGIWFAIPANLPACIAAIWAADTAVALYRWNVENLKLMAYVT
jgi:hypothetical protein